MDRWPVGGYIPNELLCSGQRGILECEGEECGECASREYGATHLARGKGTAGKRIMTDISGTSSHSTG